MASNGLTVPEAIEEVAKAGVVILADCVLYTLQVEILKQCLDELPDDNIPLYCDCWRIKDNDKINLHSVMKYLGMHEVLKNRINRKYPHSKDCNGCPYESENCFCCGDLYMKLRK